MTPNQKLATIISIKRNPDKIEEYDYHSLTAADWVNILCYTLELSKYVDWDRFKYDPRSAALLLGHYPHFEDKIDFDTFSSNEWELLVNIDPKYQEQYDCYLLKQKLEGDITSSNFNSGLNFIESIDDFASNATPNLPDGRYCDSNLGLIFDVNDNQIITTRPLNINDAFYHNQTGRMYVYTGKQVKLFSYNVI